VEDKKITIIIAAHKKYRMPEDPIYFPLHVGAEGKKDAEGHDLDLGYVKDNTGDQISLRNPNFCELTGLYWAWKNLDTDYLGLVHYRRYFSWKKKSQDPFENILTGGEAAELLEKYKVLVPRKRRYFIETLYSHYDHTHFKEHLDTTREIITKQCPEYLACFDKVMKQRWGYMFNMMVMPHDLVGEYCTWLFDILFELEREVKEKGMEDYSPFQARLYGRVSEIIFNVWILRMRETGVLKAEDIREVPYIYMEKVNWSSKIASFLKAKFLHQKYHESF